MAKEKYVSPQQEMEALSASLAQFFNISSIVPIDPSAPGQKELIAKKKADAERLQVLIKQNGIGPQSSH
jgi:hypothetical protein